jgi:CheY-like chemotaxis protein
MNDTPNHPHNPGHRKQRRRKRNFGGHSQNNPNQGQGQGPVKSRHGGGDGQQDRSIRQNRGRGQRRPAAAFVGPMDHSYRNQNGGSSQGDRFRNGAAPTPNMEPLRQREDAPTRIFAFVDDLFFLAKIQEVSRKLNVKVEFVKTEKDIANKTGENPDEKPSLIVVDLNSNSIKPLPIISKLRSKYKKPTSIVGFVSHIQGDLKVKAQEAGCDVVMPRSAFSQNLPNILRRHGAEDEPDENFNRV